MFLVVTPAGKDRNDTVDAMFDVLNYCAEALQKPR
jgi:hypothetical protein